MKYFFRIALLLFVFLPFKAFSHHNNIYIEQIDSVKIIADKFLIYNDFINSYEVSDKDLDDFYNLNPKLASKYFPSILEKYDLTLYAQFNLASILYLENKKSFLIKLWCKYKHHYRSGTVKTSDEIIYFDKIVFLFEYYKISIDTITKECSALSK